MIGVIIWSIEGCILIGIGISSFCSKKAISFLANTNPFQVRDIKAYNHATDKLFIKQNLKEGMRMNCPYCKKEMEKGYIQSKHGFGWNRKKRMVAVLSGWFADQPLEYETVAYRCQDCKKIIIDYEKEEE